MFVRDIQDILECWAPKAIAWERDNPGLQVGSLNQRVSTILITLDINTKVIEEARRKKVNLIITHHPFLFHPMKSINTDEQKGNIVELCIRYGISIYSVHTNLDFAAGGVSFALAEKLELQNISFLQRDHSNQKKIVVFVPRDHLENVRSTMAHAGAGQIGNYEFCSFGSDGTGTFKPGLKANPHIGKIGQLERVSETRLEMNVPIWKVNDVLNAMKAVHPYEEVAYDIYDVKNQSTMYGAGTIGELEQSMSQNQFLQYITTKLLSASLRYSGNRKQKIKRVAVCGGSGSDLLSVALNKCADAFITGDISYHRFEETNNNILLVDAGHYETEYPVINKIVRYLQQQIKFRKSNVKTIESKFFSNNVQYFIP